MKNKTTQIPEIIAEAGSNHNGDYNIAKKLVDIAAAAGATSIKFQFIFPEGLYLPRFLDGSNYIDNPVFKVRKNECITEDQWQEVWAHALKQNIEISASVFCSQGVALLKKLGASYVKIASTDLTNHSLIGEACSNFNNIVISTGMAEVKEITSTVNFVKNNYPENNLRLMHCVSLYPCPLEKANLKRIQFLISRFNLEVGYSDHTKENVSSAMALITGASFFEKHFTYDKFASGFDHAHALNPDELNKYVLTINNAYKVLLDNSLEVSKDESVSKIRARRGFYISRDLPAGHVLTYDDIIYVRPSTQYDGSNPSVFIGQELLNDVKKFSAIGLSGNVITVESNWKRADNYWQNEMKEKNMKQQD